MRLLSLEAVDFRNYRELVLAPGAGANLLLGANGSGKTNLLEAMHLVLTGFSQRQARDRDMVRHGAGAFMVRAGVAREALDGEVISCGVSWAGGAKRVVRGGKELTGRGRVQVLGGAVAFSPDDLELVKGPPEVRRAYLDLALAKADPGFRTVARRYSAALAQRNRLLADSAPDGPDPRLLETWTEQLVSWGGMVLAYRLRGLARLDPLAARAYRELAGPAEQLELRYCFSGGAAPPLVPPSSPLPSPPSDAPADRAGLEAFLRRAFAAARPVELARRTTMAGPGRDDLQVRIGGAPARGFASQGQQRSAAIALRLAELEFLAAVLGEPPVLLLDDVFSELDERRRSALLELLRAGGAGPQTFIAATDPQGLPPGHLHQVTTFAVSGGEVGRADRA